MEHRNQRAIVLGGSMAGLTAARVLSDHFDHVTLLERDTLPGLDEQRRGVPQGRHSHGLLAGGARALERLFPLLTRELVAEGAVEGDVVRDVIWFHAGGILARPTSGLDALFMSRPFVESRVRRRVSQIRNVQIREDSHVEGLLLSADGSRVEGVRAGGMDVRADLVVDTSGRGSKTPQWLEEAGYKRPEEERVEMALSYTTREFRRAGAGPVAVVIPPTPEGKRGGVLLAQEQGRWITTMIGHHGNSAPSDLPGFLDYARHLPSRAIYETLAQAEPIGEAITSRFPASVRRRYEHLKRFPGNFLVMGDAICSFNPIYGQGMTVAAMEGCALQQVLSGSTTNLARRFFAEAAKLVDIPWSIAVGNDLRMPETNGKRTPAVRFINWYMSRLLRAAHNDPKLSIAFQDVGNLLAPPESLMRPRNVARVVRGNLLGPPASRHQQEGGVPARTIALDGRAVREKLT